MLVQKNTKKTAFEEKNEKIQVTTKSDQNKIKKYTEIINNDQNKNIKYKKVTFRESNTVFEISN